MCGIYANYLEKIPFVLEGKQYRAGAWWLSGKSGQRSMAHSASWQFPQRVYNSYAR